MHTAAPHSQRQFEREKGAREGTQKKKKEGIFLFSYCLAFIFFPVLLCLSLLFFTHSSLGTEPLFVQCTGTRLRWASTVFGFFLILYNKSSEGWVQKQHWRGPAEGSAKQLNLLSSTSNSHDRIVVSSDFWTLNIGKSWRCNTPSKKKRVIGCRRNPLVLHSWSCWTGAKHCRWDGQLWWPSAHYPRCLCPTGQVMVTDRCFQQEYWSCAYGDFLHTPVHSGIIGFKFFLNWILRETKMSGQPKRNGFFFCPAAMTGMNVVLLFLSCLWLSGVTVHLHRGFSCTAWPSHWMCHWASATDCLCLTYYFTRWIFILLTHNFIMPLGNLRKIPLHNHCISA